MSTSQLKEKPAKVPTPNDLARIQAGLQTRARGSRSAPNSPYAQQKAVSRNTGSGLLKPVHLETTVNPVVDVDGNSSIPQHGDSLLKVCPCYNSVKDAIYVDCSVCKQEFHHSCVNLEGITQKALQKLTKWKCPVCFKPPFGLAPSNMLKEAAIELESQIETLKDSSSSIEFFNSHIKHLLLNEKQFIDHTNSIKALQADTAKLVQTCNDIKKALDSRPPASERGDTELFKKIENMIGKSNNGPSRSSPNTSSPNTSSPTLRSPAQSPAPSSPPCDPYACYIKSGVSLSTSDSLLGWLDGLTYSSVGNREVAYYGEHEYRYSGTRHPAVPMPDPIVNALEELKTLGTILPEHCPINSCLISRYKDGNCFIPRHSDDEPTIDPTSSIVTVSLGAERPMVFTDNRTGSEGSRVNLESGSVLICSRFSQTWWSHEIKQDPSVSETRYSLTFRNISPHFLNSTLILGDSNTLHIQFGPGMGKLGKWMPGQRVKAGHIEGLPEASTLSPYRNFVIHTGINSILSTKYARSDSHLINVLESKCRDIAELYPKSKVFISLLLPTKSTELNFKVNRFNNLITDMVYPHKNIQVIRHSNFGNSLSPSDGRWDMSSGSPNADDLLHLGRQGLN